MEKSPSLFGRVFPRLISQLRNIYPFVYPLPSVLGLQARTSPGFSMDARALNKGPQAYVTCILPTETSSQPWAWHSLCSCGRLGWDCIPGQQLETFPGGSCCFVLCKPRRCQKFYLRLKGMPKWCLIRLNSLEQREPWRQDGQVKMHSGQSGHNALRIYTRSFFPSETRGWQKGPWRYRVPCLYESVSMLKGKWIFWRRKLQKNSHIF